MTPALIIAPMSATKSNKDKEMAADLRKRGIWHGRRMTSTNAPTMGFGRLGEVGSAKYQRLMKSRRARKSAEG